MKFLSLFTGIGGLDLGLERAGWEVVAQVESDPWCRDILAKHWPEVERHGDVRKLSGSSIQAVDAIVGGFPCQPVSLAGRRQGENDPRWLWPHFARLVDEIRPRFVVVENVPGLWLFGGTEVVADLTALGYDSEWGMFPASAVGAPHIRERVFIVADSDCQDIGTGLRKDEPSRQWQRRFSDDGCETGRWPPEPGMGRVADGVPRRVDRLRGLGNAVVPAVGYWIGLTFSPCRPIYKLT